MTDGDIPGFPLDEAPRVTVTCTVCGKRFLAIDWPTGELEPVPSSNPCPHLDGPFIPEHTEAELEWLSRRDAVIDEMKGRPPQTDTAG